MSNDYISKRSELLFLFETINNNPNGDPNFENRPRVDESDGTCLISPYRIKRTIRDYIRDYKNEKVLITDYESLSNEYFTDNRIIIDKNNPIKNEEDLANIIFDNFIDTRLFGLAIPFKGRNKSLEYYGPVQFSYAKSLHSVVLYKNQGTAAFASKSGKRNRSFRSEYIIPYSFFELYGVINENAGQKTRLTPEDCMILESALWNGTNSLVSRSKTGHKSRILMRIIYKKKNFQLNLMDSLFSLKSQKSDEEIRDINQFSLNINRFLEILEKNKDKIQKIKLIEDSIRISGYNNIKSSLEKINLSYELIEV